MSIVGIVQEDFEQNKLFLKKMKSKMNKNCSILKKEVKLLVKSTEKQN